jgi:hypothetical protein
MTFIDAIEGSVHRDDDAFGEPVVQKNVVSFVLPV